MAALTIIAVFSISILVAARIGHRIVEHRIDDIQSRR